MLPYVLTSSSKEAIALAYEEANNSTYNPLAWTKHLWIRV